PPPLPTRRSSDLTAVDEPLDHSAASASSPLRWLRRRTAQIDQLVMTASAFWASSSIVSDVNPAMFFLIFLSKSPALPRASTAALFASWAARADAAWRSRVFA